MPPPPQAQKDPADPRVAKGAAFAEMLWWSLAKRIVKIAGEHSGWTDEQWTAATELFLRPNDYTIKVI